MSANNSTKFDLVRGEHKLEVIFNQEEDAKFVSIGDKAVVTGIASAISANKFNRYPYQEPGMAYLKASPEELEDELFRENVGYAHADVLEELRDRGLLGRTREIEPNAWYRLHWKGTMFTTENVVYLDYTEGEYEGAGGPKHNRRALKMLRGFAMLEKAAKKGLNIRLFWLPDLDVYMNKILNNMKLIDEGKIEEATKNYQVAAAQAGVRGTMARVKAKELTKDSIGDETVVLFNGEVVSVVDLFGKQAQMVIGQVTVPFIYSFDAENAADLAATAKRQRARFQVLES
jgi:hypothetical protein